MDGDLMAQVRGRNWHTQTGPWVEDVRIWQGEKQPLARERLVQGREGTGTLMALSPGVLSSGGAEGLFKDVFCACDLRTEAGGLTPLPALWTVPSPKQGLRNEARAPLM